MPVKKVSRKKLLKEPDEFISTTARTIQFFRDHERQITRAAVAVLVVIAIGAAAIYYLRSKEDRALSAQSQGLQIYQEANRAILENPAADKKEDFKKATDKFREALSLYRWGGTAQFSELYIGNCHFALKEYDQALAAYSRCLEGPFRPFALNGLAYAFEAKGDFGKALENYQKSSEDKGNPFQLEGMVGSARCYENLKQKPKALEMYQKALAQFPKSPMAEFLQWKVNELKG